MGDRSTRALLIAILLVLGFIAVQPFVERRLYSATTPRPVEPRGTLAEFERTATESSTAFHLRSFTSRSWRMRANYPCRRGRM